MLILTFFSKALTFFCFLFLCQDKKVNGENMFTSESSSETINLLYIKVDL